MYLADAKGNHLDENLYKIVGFSFDGEDILIGTNTSDSPIADIITRFDEAQHACADYNPTSVSQKLCLTKVRPLYIKIPAIVILMQDI